MENGKLILRLLSKGSPQIERIFPIESSILLSFQKAKLIDENNSYMIELTDGNQNFKYLGLQKIVENITLLQEAFNSKNLIINVEKTLWDCK